MIPGANRQPKSGQKNRLVLIIILCCGLYHLFGSGVLHAVLDKNSLPVGNTARYPEASDYKYILTWCEAYNDPLYGWPHHHEGGFQTAGCEESRCHLTSNRSYLGSNYHTTVN